MRAPAEQPGQRTHGGVPSAEGQHVLAPSCPSAELVLSGRVAHLLPQLIAGPGGVDEDAPKSEHGCRSVERLVGELEGRPVSGGMQVREVDRRPGAIRVGEVLDRPADDRLQQLAGCVELQLPVLA